MRISDWSSDVCSSDLLPAADFGVRRSTLHDFIEVDSPCRSFRQFRRRDAPHVFHAAVTNGNRLFPKRVTAVLDLIDERLGIRLRSEEHTSELQSLMRTSYAVFCLQKKKITNNPS